MHLFINYPFTTQRFARNDRGQSTAEYALLILGAAAIALIVVSWATGTDKITSLFDAVIDSILDDI